MKELVRHIEFLLLDNDCVIIPQFGGFVTRHMPSKYIEDEQLFLPPIRTVGFNAQLKEDDGLLVNSYMRTYQTTETEARTLLKEQTDQLKQELLENGSCDMGSLGQLTLDENGLLKFSPCQAGTVCPAFYGLDALLFPPLLEKTEEITSSINQDIKEKNHNEITIRLKKTWLQNIAAVAAVVIMFLMLSPSARNTGILSNDKAEFANLMTMNSQLSPAQKVSTDNRVSLKNEETNKEGFNTINKSNKLSKEISVKRVNTKTADNINIETCNTKVNHVSQVESLKGFCIVVASAISKKNAHLFVEKLHNKGFNDAQVYTKGHMTRVVFPGYSSEEEAYKDLRKLNKTSDEFSSAWVYYIK